MLQLAVADDLLDLRRQQLLALLLAHLDHLVAEDAHVHLSLQLAVPAGASVIGYESQRVDQILERVLLLVAARDERAERVLVEGAAALRVHIADHLRNLGLARVEVEAAHDRPQVVRLDEAICILIEETEDLSDLRDHDIREHLSLVARAGAPRSLHHLTKIF